MKYKNKIILTDFFDTVMFRHIHSSQIFVQWAKVILHRFPILRKTLDNFHLQQMLHECRQELHSKYEEPPYKEVIGYLYDRISKTTNIGISKDKFIEYSLQVDIAIELGCQYPNIQFINRLKKAKRKGAKIYIVSDFYLSAKCYETFLSKAHCKDLFDGIYVSVDYNRTKYKGDLYDYVIKDLGIDTNNVVMFGDSRHSDVKIPKQKGICSYWYFPFTHKIKTNISRKWKLDYGKSIIRQERKRMYRDTLFEEYSLNIYYFLQKLSIRAKELGANKLAFLSRGGYFLLESYNKMQFLLGDNEIKGEYCYNSRKVCFNAEKEKETKGDQYLFMQTYMDSFKSKNNNLYIVDEGWYNHSQQSMCKTFGFNIYGFYIGSCFKDAWDYDNVCHREGLLFNYVSKTNKSKYYGIFCTNRSMYEQILTAPHGSVIGYKKNSDNMTISPILQYNDKEIYLYNKYIGELQEKLLLDIQGLCVWLIGKNMEVTQLAKMILRSSIFSNHERCMFLNELDANRYDNCSNGKIKDKTIQNIRLDFKKIFVHPNEYVGIFAKLQRKLDKNIFFRINTSVNFYR